MAILKIMQLERNNAAKWYTFENYHDEMYLKFYFKLMHLNTYSVSLSFVLILDLC